MPKRSFVAAGPVTQKPKSGEAPFSDNDELVGKRFHGSILLSAGEFCKVARTTKGRTRFPFKIILVPPDRPAPKAPWAGTHKWKHRAIYNIKMELAIQVEKASNRAKYDWFKFYSVRGYGAPGIAEFICPYSGMIAKTIKPEEAASMRKYWVGCAKKSREMLNWLSSLDPARYSTGLNSYLLRTIVTTYNIREIEEYQAKYPFESAKPWQKL